MGERSEDLTPRPDRGDEVQIAGWIGNIVRVDDVEGTCRIAWWMPTGGPYGSAFSDDVPLDGLHVRQQATTSILAPAPPPERPQPVETAHTLEARLRSEAASGIWDISVSAAIDLMIEAADALAAAAALPVRERPEPGSLHLCAEDRFHLWTKLYGVQQEAEAGKRRTERDGVVDTLDHIYEEVTTALSYFDAPAAADPGTVAP